jgi:hypothetical protein
MGVTCNTVVRGLFGDREDTEGQLVHCATGRPRLTPELHHITRKRFVREQVKGILNQLRMQFAQHECRFGHQPTASGSRLTLAYSRPFLGSRWNGLSCRLHSYSHLFIQ